MYRLITEVVFDMMKLFEETQNYSKYQGFEQKTKILKTSKLLEQIFECQIWEKETENFLVSNPSRRWSTFRTGVLSNYSFAFGHRGSNESQLYWKQLALQRNSFGRIIFIFDLNLFKNVGNHIIVGFDWQLCNYTLHAFCSRIVYLKSELFKNELEEGVQLSRFVFSWLKHYF